MNVVEIVNKSRPNDTNVTAMHCVSSYPCEEKILIYLGWMY